MRILASMAAAALAGVTAVAAQNTPPQAADLAARLQTRYEAIRDFTADFTQTYQGVLLRKAATERGKLSLKKPSRVRFAYEAPERKEFVSDGSQFYSYFPKERAGTVTPLPKDTEAPTAWLFLAGRGNLTRDFSPSLPAAQPDTEWHLNLVPRAERADFQSLTLMVDRRTLALRGFITVDDQGTNTIRLTNLKENTGLRDSAFLFRFPPGTEVSR